MIIKTFDQGWGPEWPTKQFENAIISQVLHRLSTDDSQTVVIQSTWYTDQLHQEVLAWLHQNTVTHIVLVSMLDPSIPQASWFAEVDCEVIPIGYYPAGVAVDYWALLFDQQYQSISEKLLFTANNIDTAYMCLNRKPHRHRHRLYHELVELNIVDQGIVSYGFERQLAVDNPHDNLAPNATKDHFGAPNDIVSLGHTDNWIRSFLNVVTETRFDIRETGFVSEKIYKPILGCRPFLVYASDGAVQWLTDRGFEPYTQNFLDISDLDLSDPNNISKFLKTLCEQTPTYWKKKFLDLHEKIMYNKIHFAEYVQSQRTIINKGI